MYSEYIIIIIVFVLCVQKLNGSSGGDKPKVAAPATGKGKKAEPKGSIAAMFAQSKKKADTDAEKKKESSKKEDTKEVGTP